MTQTAPERNNRGHWKPGQSGNPGGKTAEKWFRTALVIELKREAKNAKNGQKTNRLQSIAAKVCDLAEDGHIPAIEFIAQRVDGPPIKQNQTVDNALAGAIAQRTQLEAQRMQQLGMRYAGALTARSASPQPDGPIIDVTPEEDGNG